MYVAFAEVAKDWLCLNVCAFTKVEFSAFFLVELTSIHDYWKNYSFDDTDLCRKVMTLLFNTLSRFVTAFLPNCKCLLIS